MKKLILPLIAISILLTSCGPTAHDAAEFSDSMVAAQKGCIEGEKNFYKTCDGLNAIEIKSSYASFTKQVDSSLKLLQDIKENKEFSEFKENALMLVAAYKDLIPKEYNEYAQIYSIPGDQYTTQDSIRCVEVAERINSTLNPLVKSFIAEQEVFAKKWNFTLTK